jgi:hypothetical protein
MLWRTAIIYLPLGFGLRIFLTSWSSAQLTIHALEFLLALSISVWALRASLKGPQVLLTGPDSHEPEIVTTRIAFVIWLAKTWRGLLALLILFPVFRMLKPLPIVGVVLPLIVLSFVDLWSLREALSIRYKFFTITPSPSALKSTLSPKG